MKKKRVILTVVLLLLGLLMIARWQPNDPLDPLGAPGDTLLEPEAQLPETSASEDAPAVKNTTPDESSSLVTVAGRVVVTELNQGVSGGFVLDAAPRTGVSSPARFGPHRLAA